MDMEIRKKGIGGSEIAAVLGISKYKTPLEVFLDKKGLLEEKEESEAMSFGKLLEPVIADYYEKKNNKKLINPGKTIFSEKYPWLFATIDRLVEEDGGIVECKNVGEFMKSKWGFGFNKDMPDDYYLQCIHYRIVYDAPYVDCAAFVGGNKYVEFRYEKDKELEDFIIKKSKKFWEENVLNDVAPAARSYKLASAVYPNSNNEVILANEEILKIYKRLEKISKIQKNLSEKENLLKKEICLYMQEKDTLFAPDGSKLVTWKTQERNSFDTKSFKDHYPDLYKDFCTKISSRVFRLKGE